MSPKTALKTFDSYIATGGFYLNMELRGAIEKKVLRVVYGVFIYLFVVYLYIYLVICYK